MITIGIYMKNTNFIGEFYVALDSLMKQVSDWQLRTYQSGNEILDALECGQFDCNLLLLDTALSDRSKKEIAAFIRENQLDTDLIFWGTATEKEQALYGNNAFAYILKPVTKPDIVTEISRYLAERKLHPKTLNVPIKGVVHQIPLYQVRYIESAARKAIIHTETRDYECYQRLDDLEELLKNDGFIRCHQSYLAALPYMKQITAESVAIGDNILPVSRKYASRVKKALTPTAREPAATDCYLTESLNRNRNTTGCLVGISGAYTGSVVRFYPEQEITLGRDGSHADLVINLPLVSRRHCTITYHDKDHTYSVTDFSKNGTFIKSAKERLIKNQTYTIPAGTGIYFGDTESEFHLG